MTNETVRTTAQNRSEQRTLHTVDGRTARVARAPEKQKICTGSVCFWNQSQFDTNAEMPSFDKRDQIIKMENNNSSPTILVQKLVARKRESSKCYKNNFMVSLTYKTCTVIIQGREFVSTFTLLDRLYYTPLYYTQL